MALESTRCIYHTIYHWHLEQLNPRHTAKHNYGRHSVQVELVNQLHEENIEIVLPD